MLKILLFIVPAPTSIILSPPYPGLVRPVGSAINMTCNIELSPVVNIPVTVITVWTGPAGFMTTTTTQSIMGNYTSTAVIGSFGRDESGAYTCTATATTTSSFLRNSASHSGTATITVGEATIKNDHILSYFSLKKYYMHFILFPVLMGEIVP